ncbi:MAG: deoxyguanosinetriphosphate triphosphohydrolase [Rubrivivax sp.]|nr:deoxyguanosinetriphosphate triphosphohydrolase [Rubrivivax sp.]
MSAVGPLAPWAAWPERTRGRRHPEPAPVGRSEFQRDRDRVVHCTAFRRLMYKTQVFLNHEGDLFRTRLTHSLEVAQLSRSIARQLRLNEDLVEAIALAHDLGHTPFGHAGQEALHERMQAHGGFEHNLQSLRVVDALEQRYADFDGLNLCFETREGILKHCSRTRALEIEAREPGGVAQRFLAGRRPSLEAQVVNLADEIAYNAHDIDDGLRSGLLDPGELVALDAYGRQHQRVLAEHPGIEHKGRRLVGETLRRLLAAHVQAVVEQVQSELSRDPPADVDAVRERPPIVGLPAVARAEFDALKRHLFRRLYRHEQVVQTTTEARRVVQDLFDAYLADPTNLPPDHAAMPDRHRAVADYIAGMTDRFALREHQRLTGRTAFAVAHRD